MATRLGRRISRALTNALQARDRAEMRAVNALLSLVEVPGKPRRRSKAGRRKPYAKDVR
jgi:hypothetical protein